MKKFTRKVKKAFTLIELVVVIAVIAILSAVSVGTYFGVMNSANRSAVEQEANQVRTALRTQTVTEATYSFDGKSADVVLTSKGLQFTFESSVTNPSQADYIDCMKSIYRAFAGEDVTTLPGDGTISKVSLDTTATTTVTDFTYTIEGKGEATLSIL